MLVKSTIIGVKKMHLLIDDALFVPLNLYMTSIDHPFYNPKLNLIYFITKKKEIQLTNGDSHNKRVPRTISPTV